MVSITNNVVASSILEDNDNPLSKVHFCVNSHLRKCASGCWKLPNTWLNVVIGQIRGGCIVAWEIELEHVFVMDRMAIVASSKQKADRGPFEEGRTMVKSW